MSFEHRDSCRIIAVDPSLTCSGWALFVLGEHGPIAVGTLSPPGPEVSMPQRMKKLQSGIEQLLEHLQMGEGDVLVCEGPAPLVKNPQSALKVEGVRGLFETLARRRGMQVPGRINPRTIQSELLGMKGKQLPRAEVKAWARATAMQMFGEELDQFSLPRIPQDVIDAVLIGSYVLSRLDISNRTGIHLEAALLPQPQGRGYRGRRRATGWSEKILK